MRRPSDIDDVDVERLFAGEAPSDDARAGRSRPLLRRSGGSVSEGLHGVLRSGPRRRNGRGCGAPLGGRRTGREAGERGPRPDESRPRSAGSGAWKRMTRGFPASRLARAAAIAAMLALVFGGVAFAGALPRPLQNAVAGAAQHVGIDLPRGDDGNVDGAAADAAAADAPPATRPQTLRRPATLMTATRASTWGRPPRRLGPACRGDRRRRPSQERRRGRRCAWPAAALRAAGAKTTTATGATR